MKKCCPFLKFNSRSLTERTQKKIININAIYFLIGELASKIIPLLEIKPFQAADRSYNYY
jgi:hypothetical protein